MSKQKHDIARERVPKGVELGISISGRGEVDGDGLGGHGAGGGGGRGSEFGGGGGRGGCDRRGSKVTQRKQSKVQAKHLAAARRMPVCSPPAFAAFCVCPPWNMMAADLADRPRARPRKMRKRDDQCVIGRDPKVRPQRPHGRRPPPPPYFDALICCPIHLRGQRTTRGTSPRLVPTARA
jgi:hypothetical protein